MNEKNSANCMKNPASNPLVSIIILSFNNAEFIAKTFESVLEQSYTNIEIIVVDDCSSDNSVQLCREFVANNAGDRVIKLIENPINMGLCNNLNNVINNHISGEWIKLVASDDYLLKDCVSNLISFVTTVNDPSVACVYGKSFRLIDDQIDGTLGSYFSAEKLLRRGRNPIPAVAALFSRQHLINIGYFMHNGYVEDVYLWQAFVLANYKLLFLDKEVAVYRIRSSGNIMSNNNKVLYSLVENNMYLSRKYNTNQLIEQSMGLLIKMNYEYYKQNKTKSIVNFFRYIKSYFLNKLISL